MTDLRTTLGSLELRNPVIAGSSELTMTEAGILSCMSAGAGAVVAKSVNESPDAARQLDRAEYVLLTEDHRASSWANPGKHDSLLNRSGLAQTLLPDWVRMLARCREAGKQHGSELIGSITVASAEGAARIAARLEPSVSAIEVNLSAPHGREVKSTTVRQLTDADAVRRYTAAARDAVSCPLWIKLSGQSDDPVALAEAAAGAGADVVVLIGRFGGFMPNLDTWNPFIGSHGAIGGSWALPVSLYWVSKCALRLTDTPLVGTNGARDGADVARFLLSGARAVEMASAPLMHGPGVLGQAVAELDEYLTGRGVASLGEVIGASVRRTVSYAEVQVGPGRPLPWDDERPAAKRAEP
ncbi:MAG: dihydroorotate dehydrogenase [Candidatus Dormibacter sp.]